ncbi:MAG: hypothetical protein P8Q23_03535 [Paracoccaceae bacterium]|nr:hypothetical protein [Paracoccaceae bacterium]
MSVLGPQLAELFLTLAGLVGLACVVRVLKSTGEFDPINRRFLFGLRVVMMLYLGRAGMLLTGIEAFRVLVLLGGGLVPIAVLLLCEGLLRRHAPRWVKGLMATGTVVFCATSIVVSGGIDPLRLWGVLGFQILAWVWSAG